MTKAKPPKRVPAISWEGLASPETAAMLDLHYRWASATGSTGRTAEHRQAHSLAVRLAEYSRETRRRAAAVSVAEADLRDVLREYHPVSDAVEAAERLAEAKRQRDVWREVHHPLGGLAVGWAEPVGTSSFNGLLRRAEVDRARLAAWVAKQDDVPGDQSLIAELRNEGRRAELEALVAKEQELKTHLHDFGAVG